MTILDPEILEVFREEAIERLDRMVETLLALESGQAAPDAVDSLFRDAHSIKGSAGMVGLEDARAISHKIEDALEGPREHGTFPPQLIVPLLEAADALRLAVSDLPAPEPALEPPPVPDRQSGPIAQPQSMRMSGEKVDRWLDAVGETVIHRRRLEHLILEGGTGVEDERLEGELAEGERALEELQDSVLQMRAFPLSSITGQFPRAVRDLAMNNHKEIELEITGADTKLDRLILEGISDPIGHLLRNCVAHGIELPAEREAAGKPARGHIWLRAEQRGGRIAVEVADDGRGVAPELVAQAGPEGSLVAVLAQAGVSTASEVTDAAGRGVGMDAVKAHVESLRGELEVHSEPGRGTTVTMLFPLTLALLHVLLVQRGGQTFGLPLTSVETALAVGPTTSLGGRESIEVRGRSVPLSDLAAIIGAPAPRGDSPRALVVSAGGRRVAVVCDSIVGEEEVVMKSLGPLLAAVPGYLGASIHGDGGVVLILDPVFLTAFQRAAGPSAREQELPSSKVLVVDDQFTVRELQRSILEAAGYRVDTARDGRDALTKVSGESDVDIVVTDVDMPEMTGMELLQTLRKDSRHASLPVIVVTGRGSEQDRRLGLEAGADAYIVKEEFDQRALLETVDRLLAR